MTLTRRRTAPLVVGAGWSSPVAHQAHNLKVAGSNPAPATIAIRLSGTGLPERPPSGAKLGISASWSWIAMPISRARFHPSDATLTVTLPTNRREGVPRLDSPLRIACGRKHGQPGRPRDVTATADPHATHLDGPGKMAVRGGPVRVAPRSGRPPLPGTRAPPVMHSLARRGPGTHRHAADRRGPFDAARGRMAARRNRVTASPQERNVACQRPP